MGGKYEDKDMIEIASIVIGSGGVVAWVKSIFPNWGLKNRKK